MRLSALILSTVGLIGMCSCGQVTAPTPPITKTAAKGAAPLESTFDRRIQTLARNELVTMMREWSAEAAVVIVLDAATGEVRAMEGRDGDRDDAPVANRAFVTGSTLKALTIAAALEEETITPDARVDCQPRPYGSGKMHDPKPYGMLSIGEVMATSSNVGTSRIYDTMGWPRFEPWLRRFHIGEPPGVIPPITDGASIAAAIVAIGESATATPLQMAAAYGAFFNGGEWVAPTFSSQMLGKRERILRPRTAETIVAILEGAVTSELGSGKLAAVPGHRVAGKTGTGDLGTKDGVEKVYASFIGAVLDDTPKLVVLIGLVSTEDGASGPSAAAPAFGRLAARMVDHRR
jgi:cell division protein FtsI (penicillin-binding protein 3)